jgi:glutamine amidotransferase
MGEVVVIDYGAGNILSVSRALRQVGAAAMVTDDPVEVERADRVLLPGVGAFPRAMRKLHERGLVRAIQSFAASGRPFLGICLGMQIMLDESEEFGHHEGLGLIPGKVVAIPDSTPTGERMKVPCIGWAEIFPPEDNNWTDTILKDAAPPSYFYFVHSYQACPVYQAHRLAVADYSGRKITAAVKHCNLTGLQFHPEKSGPLGLLTLEAFSNQALP